MVGNHNTGFSSKNIGMGLVRSKRRAGIVSVGLLTRYKSGKRTYLGDPSSPNQMGCLQCGQPVRLRRYFSKMTFIQVLELKLAYDHPPTAQCRLHIELRENDDMVVDTRKAGNPVSCHTFQKVMIYVLLGAAGAEALGGRVSCPIPGAIVRVRLPRVPVEKPDERGH